MTMGEYLKGLPTWRSCPSRMQDLFHLPGVGSEVVRKIIGSPPDAPVYVKAGTGFIKVTVLRQ